MFITVLSFIIVLGILIFIHEFGHYIVAKLVNIRVEEFALGFGPRLLSFEAGETIYSLRIVPLGGFCKMTGEVPPEELTEEEKSIYDKAHEQGKCFEQKTPFQRFAVIFNGPFMNFILAVILYAVMFFSFGIPVRSIDSNVIGDITPGYPAAESGFQIGDEVISINDKEITRWDDMHDIIIESSDEVLKFTVIRGDETLNINVTPIYMPQIEGGYIGILSETENKNVAFLESIKLGLMQTWNLLMAMIAAVYGMITGSVAPDVGGPVMIANMIGQAANIGMKSILNLTALLSVNLGILNLLPLPALDGGHILLIIIEKLRGNPVNREIQNKINFVGFMLLMLLMVFVIFKDIYSIFL